MGRKKQKINYKPVNTCKHEAGFQFVRTSLGVKRICRKACGYSVTDVARGFLTDPPSEKKGIGYGYDRGQRRKKGRVAVMSIAV